MTGIAARRYASENTTYVAALAVRGPVHTGEWKAGREVIECLLGPVAVDTWKQEYQQPCQPAQQHRGPSGNCGMGAVWFRTGGCNMSVRVSLHGVVLSGES